MVPRTRIDDDLRSPSATLVATPDDSIEIGCATDGSAAVVVRITSYHSAGMTITGIRLTRAQLRMLAAAVQDVLNAGAPPC